MQNLAYIALGCASWPQAYGSRVKAREVSHIIITSVTSVTSLTSLTSLTINLNI